MIALLELLVSVWALTFLATQIGIPLWNGTVLFPMFRREAVLRHKLVVRAQKELEDELHQQLKSRS